MYVISYHAERGPGEGAGVRWCGGAGERWRGGGCGGAGVWRSEGAGWEAGCGGCFGVSALMTGEGGNVSQPLHRSSITAFHSLPLRTGMSSSLSGWPDLPIFRRLHRATHASLRKVKQRAGLYRYVRNNSYDEKGRQLNPRLREDTQGFVAKRRKINSE